MLYNDTRDRSITTSWLSFLRASGASTSSVCAWLGRRAPQTSQAPSAAQRALPIALHGGLVARVRLQGAREPLHLANERMPAAALGPVQLDVPSHDGHHQAPERARFC